MSTFLGFFSYLMPIGSTVAGVQSMLSSNLTACSWQIVRQSVIPNSVFGTLANAANAFDMNSTTQAGGGGTGNIGCVTPTAFLPTVMYVQVNNDGGGSAPFSFDLEYSINSGSTWQTLQTWTNQNVWTNMERRRYVVYGATAQTYWRMNVSASNGANTYITEWTLEDQNGNWLTNTTFLDMIPPTTEFIGNSVARDVLRIIVNSNSINMLSVAELFTPLPQMYLFDTPIGGAVTLSVHIANTVSYVGTAGNTAEQNARGLYEALKNTSDSDFALWNWTWLTSLQGTAGGGYIQATQITPATNVAMTSTNITSHLRGSYSNAPMVQGSQLAPQNGVTIDLINGFVFYLQVCSRGIALAIKTNSSYVTPVHACYGDNPSALAQIPTADIPGIPCTPIDLFVGTDQATDQTGAMGYTSHWWGVVNAWSGSTGNWGMQGVDNSTYNSSSIWSHHQVPGQIQDFGSSSYATSGIETVNMSMDGEGLFNGGDSGLIYSVHRMSCNPTIQYPAVSYPYYPAYGRLTGPAYANLDWYKFVGSLSDEQLIFSPSTDYTTTITLQGLPTDTTINVTDAIGFPTTGFIFIDGEIIQYTGITPTAFTGCTRGMYLTTGQGLFPGTTVFIGGWFVKIQNGLLFAGYQLPV